MKNITVSVEDEVYRSARIEAAKRNLSLSAVVRGYLRAFALGSAPLMDDSAEDQDRKARLELLQLFQEAHLVLGYHPNRENTYATVKVINPFA